jgi:CubicO group peptidase (beta-lactamase class C family)
MRLDPEATPKQCQLDSIDQGGFGIDCHFVDVAGADAASLTLEVPAVMGTWTGTLYGGGTILKGTWSQAGHTAPLSFSKQLAAIERPKIVLQPSVPAVDANGLQAVLDADLADVIARGALAPTTGTGVAIGVVTHGVRRVLTYGSVKPDSLFEIGSVTKTFTGLVLAQMAAQKKVRLDEPVRALLPAGTVAKPEGAEITLLDLSDQHSGLPRLPDNMKPADPANPYADYDDKALFAWLATHGVALPKDAPFGYSNLGVGLLGDALAHRAGMKYEALLRQQVTGPLGMRDTVIALTPALKTRMLEGHDGAYKPAHLWDLDALAGAGAIRSTAGDMLTYLDAQLHPDHLPASVKASASGKTLAAAIAESHVVRAKVGEGMEIALNWFHVVKTGSYWHNGGTAGFATFAEFSPADDFAVVVLCNMDDTSPTSESFADKLGTHVAQRLAGLPALSLSPP